jgi:hypothetical protein
MRDWEDPSFIAYPGNYLGRKQGKGVGLVGDGAPGAVVWQLHFLRKSLEIGLSRIDFLSLFSL